MSDREKEIRDKWSSKSRQESAIYKFAWDDIAFLLSTIDALRAENEKLKKGDCVHASNIITLTTATRCGMCVQDEIITELTKENAKMRKAINSVLNGRDIPFDEPIMYLYQKDIDKLAEAEKGKVY